MKDIETREDILLIMRKFYDKLLADDSINFFFTKVTSVDQHLEAHFDILATFWEQSLFIKMFMINMLLQKSILKLGYIILIQRLMNILKVNMPNK